MAILDNFYAFFATKGILYHLPLTDHVIEFAPNIKPLHWRGE